MTDKTELDLLIIRVEHLETNTHYLQRLVEQQGKIIEAMAEVLKGLRDAVTGP